MSEAFRLPTTLNKSFFSLSHRALMSASQRFACSRSISDHDAVRSLRNPTVSSWVIISADRDVERSRRPCKRNAATSPLWAIQAMTRLGLYPRVVDHSKKAGVGWVCVVRRKRETKDFHAQHCRNMESVAVHIEPAKQRGASARARGGFALWRAVSIAVGEGICGRCRVSFAWWP